MIFHWDFFGPDAEMTAKHFQKHFSQFENNLGFTSKEQGFFSADDEHTCFWVSIVDQSTAETTRQKLRPKRSLEDEEHRTLLNKIADSKRSET